MVQRAYEAVRRHGSWHTGFSRGLAISLILSMLLPVSRLMADEAQVGLSYAGLNHVNDSFSSGVYHFRPGLTNSFERVVSYSPFPTYGGGEVFFRFSGPLGEGHTFGVAIGEETASGARTREFRGGYLTNAEHTFLFQYMLFTYRYGIPLTGFSRNMVLHVGGGMGFLPNTQWSISGYQSDLGAYNKSYSALLTSTTGYQYRIETALQKKWGNLFVEVGARLDYRMAADFSGTAGGATAYAMTLSDGTHAVTPDLLDLYSMQQTAKNQYVDAGLQFNGVVRHEAQMIWATTGLFLSAGLRF